jgi:hypothetical protein
MPFDPIRDLSPPPPRLLPPLPPPVSGTSHEPSSRLAGPPQPLHLHHQQNLGLRPPYSHPLPPNFTSPPYPSASLPATSLPASVPAAASPPASLHLNNGIHAPPPPPVAPLKRKVSLGSLLDDNACPPSSNNANSDSNGLPPVTPQDQASPAAPGAAAVPRRHRISRGQFENSALRAIVLLASKNYPLTRVCADRQNILPLNQLATRAGAKRFVAMLLSSSPRAQTRRQVALLFSVRFQTIFLPLHPPLTI